MTYPAEPAPTPPENRLTRHLDLRVDRHDPAVDHPADLGDRLDAIIRRMRERPGTLPQTSTAP